MSSIDILLSGTNMMLDLIHLGLFLDSNPWFLVPKRFQSLHRGSNRASSRGTSFHAENHIWMHRSWSNGAIRAFAGTKQTKRKEDHLTVWEFKKGSSYSSVTCHMSHIFSVHMSLFFNDPRSDLTNLIP